MYSNSSLAYRSFVMLTIIIKLFYVVTLLLIRYRSNNTETTDTTNGDISGKNTSVTNSDTNDSDTSTLQTYNTVSKNLFMGMIAVLIIYLFNPNKPSPVFIEGETKLLLFLFGILSLLEIPWTIPFNKLIDSTHLGLTQHTFSIVATITITAVITTGIMFLK